MKTDNKIHKTLHRKLKIEQHDLYLKPGMNSDAPEGYKKQKTRYWLLFLFNSNPYFNMYMYVFHMSTPVNIQYRYIVGKYKIYLYER